MCSDISFWSGARKNQMAHSIWMAWDSAVPWHYLTTTSQDHESGNGVQRRTTAVTGQEPQAPIGAASMDRSKWINSPVPFSPLFDSCLCSQELNAMSGTEEVYGPWPFRSMAKARAGWSIQQRSTGVFCTADSFIHDKKCPASQSSAWMDIASSSLWQAHLPSRTEALPFGNVCFLHRTSLNTDTVSSLSWLSLTGI